MLTTLRPPAVYPPPEQTRGENLEQFRMTESWALASDMNSFSLGRIQQTQNTMTTSLCWSNNTSSLKAGITPLVSGHCEGAILFCLLRSLNILRLCAMIDGVFLDEWCAMIDNFLWPTIFSWKNNELIVCHSYFAKDDNETSILRSRNNAGKTVNCCG